MTAKFPEPALVFSSLSEKPSYVQAMKNAGGIETTLNFGWYNAFMKLDGYSEKAFSDISFMNRIVAEEVKTEADLAASFNDGRLSRFVWFAALLRDHAGIIAGYAIIIRTGLGIDQHAERLYDSACEWLARNQTRWNFKVLIARDESMVPRVARSFMREFNDPKPREMPPPVINKELLEWPFGIQSLCTIPGIYIELAKQLLSKKTYWDIAIDAHEMELQEFTTEYGQLYQFGGKNAVRLTSIWTAMREPKFVQPESPVFVMRDPVKMMQQRNETGA
nr:hypothetical protein [Candidatus Sigynarchaeota archaeon]